MTSHMVRPWSVRWATTAGRYGSERVYALSPAEALTETIKALPATIRDMLRTLEVKEI